MSFSVFDTTNKEDFTKTKMFLGNGISVARYDRQKYPFLEKLTEKQLSFFWLPHEVDCTKDARDFKVLTDHEKHIFTSNLKRQILLDSVQGRAPTAAFGPICSLPELENWIVTWAFSETIHSRSYTHIIRNVYANPSEIFDEMMDIEEIVACANDISNNYDELIRLTTEMNYGCNASNMDAEDLYEIKRALWLCLMSVNILEGVRFYVSFACSWAFAELKKMEGNAKIIKLICFSDDTDILTTAGWKRFKDLLPNDKVAQYHKDGTVTFVIPTNYIEQDHDGEMVHFGGTDRARFDILVTPDHRMVYEENAQLKESLAKDFNPSCEKYFYGTGAVKGERVGLTQYDRFRIAVQADGFISDRYDGSISGTIPVAFHLKKSRKIDRLQSIIDSLSTYGVTYTKTIRDDGFTDFTVNVPKMLTIDKTFNWVELDTVDYLFCRQFIEELSQWDGHLRNKDFSHIYYSTTDERCADVIQAIASLSGWVHYRGIQKDDRKETYKDVHRISIYPRKTKWNTLNSAKSKKVVSYTGKVYCVTVPSSMIIVRRNNKVAVCGQCRDENLHLAGTQQLLKVMPSDDSDFVAIRKETEDACIKMFVDAVNQEKAWAKYLFKDGSMIGLNEQLLSDYIEWIAHRRMLAVGLRSPYKGGSNPLPWTQKWIAGADVQVAPQESEIQTYTIGQIKMDMGDTSIKDWEL